LHIGDQHMGCQADLLVKGITPHDAL